MVVPSGLADSLNLPGILGMASAAGAKPPSSDEDGNRGDTGAEE